MLELLPTLETYKPDLYRAKMLSDEPRYNELREQLTGVIANAYVHHVEKSPESLPPEAIINNLAPLGMQVLEPCTNYAAESRNKCAHFAFGTVYREDWAVPYASDIPDDLWRRPLQFLGELNYQLTDTPDQGDLVAYGSVDVDNDQPWVEHFGIYEGNKDDKELVVSKLGVGPVVRHDIQIIASKTAFHKKGWGDRCWFFKPPRN